MADQRLDRRQILKGAGALGAAGALVALQGPTRGLADDTPGIEGSWLVVVTQTGPNANPPFKALHSFTAGGVFIGTAAGSTTGPFPSGAAQGVWAHTGEGTFAVKSLELYTDPQGKFTGTGKIHAIVTLDESRDAYDGPQTFDFYNPDGSFSFSVPGTAHGRRIRLDRR